MTPRGLKVLISDDHPLIRAGLKRILLEGGNVSCVGEASRGQEAMDAVRREPWDVVILDINLGGGSGMDVLKEIKAEFPRLPVLILSMYPDEQFALPLIRAGASGYLNKHLAGTCLAEAIRQVLAGGQYLSPKMAEQLSGKRTKP